MGKSQRDKGKRIELAACEVLRPLWPDVRRRAMQSRGGNEGADLDGTPGYHVEVGGGKTVSAAAKWEQANEDMRAFEESVPPEFRKDTVPIALTKRDRGPWLVTMSAEAFVELVRKVANPPCCGGCDADCDAGRS